jgi:hypothetical protein
MDRSFVVRVNDELSQPCPISAGVLQGAVISPILFSIYINDILVNNKQNFSYYLLFADDLASISCFKKPGKLMSFIRGYMLKLEIWLRKWKLKMSAEKFSYSVFNNYYKKMNLDIKLYDKNIPHYETPKFLGVYFDERLTFKRQIAEIRNKCVQRLNIIKIISHRSWKIE